MTLAVTFAVAGPPVGVALLVQGASERGLLVAFAVLDALIIAAVVRSFVRYESRLADRETDSRLTARDAEQRSRELAEAQRIASIGSWTAIPGEQTIVFSQELKRIIGLEPSDAAPDIDSYVGRVVPADRERVRRELTAAFEEGLSGESEHRVRGSDGRVVHLYARVEAEHDPDGRVRRLLGTTQDVTERFENDRALRRERRLLAEAQAVGHVGSWEWDMETQTLSWSEEQFRLHGLEPDRPVPGPEEYFEELIHLDDGERAHQAMADAVERRVSFEVEYRVPLADDGVRTLLISGGPMGEEGKVTRLAGTARDVTADRETAAKQRQAEHELRRTSRYFELAGDLLCTTTSKGYLSEVNPKWTEVLGWSEAELRARPFFDFVHPDDVAATRAQSVRGRKGGVTVGFVLRFQTKDGGWRWLDWSAISLAAEGLSFGSARDITDRRLTERYLDAQHATTELLAEGGRVAPTLSALLRIVCDRLDWQVGACWMPVTEDSVTELRRAAVWWTPGQEPTALEAASVDAGLSADEELVVRAWNSHEPLWVPDMGLNGTARARAAHQDGLHASVVLPVQSSGEVLAVLELLCDEQRRPQAELLEILTTLAGQVGQFLERKHGEAALEARERETRQILESAHDAFVAIDEHGIIFEWNHQAEEVFGWTRAQALGRDLAETLIPDRMRGAHRVGIEHFLTTGKGPVLDQLVELPALRQNGEEFPVELTISVQQTDAGRSFYAFARDITERNRSRDELAVARDRALEASQQKSEFLANMSHEIRTPMNGVVGMTELLLETELSPEQREYAELARTSSEALVAVVNDILDLSKIEAGKLEFDGVDFRPGELVEDVSDLMATVAHEKGLELSTLVESGLPPVVHGDEVRVRQVLLNLVSNAVKFTTAGEVAVHVFPIGEGESSRVCFEVRDTGIGIAADKLDHIFDSFSQADASTTRRYGGTGLGLTITQQLTELMGGQIAVISELGVGSTFRAILPFAAASSGADLDAFQAAEDLVGVKALIADDNATNRFIFSHHATAWGMDVTTAVDGREAIQTLRAAARADAPFDVALIDMRMPRLDGIGVALEVRADAALRDTPLLMLSSSFDDRHAAREAGIDVQLQKPVRREKLFRTLVTSVRPERVEAAVPRADVGRAGARSRPMVLIAEDNEINQTLAIRMLEKRGIDSEVVANGREAVDAAARKHFDLLLMDCQMPELDGYEATREIRQSERGKDRRLPIVAMTAHSMRSDRERCIAAGMDDYLSKPLNTRAFEQALARWLRKPVFAPQPEATGRVELGGEQDRVLDREAINRLREQVGSGDGLGRFVEMFSTQIPSKLEQLRAALDAGDTESVAKLAHFLKGSSSSLGAVRMAEICRELEHAPLAHAEGLVDDLEAAFGRSVEELRTEASRV